MIKIADKGGVLRGIFLMLSVSGVLSVGFVAGQFPSSPASGNSTEDQFPASGYSARSRPVADRESLLALGYAPGDEKAPMASGVTRHVRGAAYESYNLYTSGHAPAAFLMTMDGKIVHSWRHSFEQLWPGKSAEGLDVSYWRRVYAFANGDVLAIIEPFGIFRLDKDSNLIWANDCGAHHDFYVRDDGHIFVLAQANVTKEVAGAKRSVYENYVLELGSDGKELRRVGILDALRESDYHPLLNDASADSDVLHTNSIAYLLPNAPYGLPAFQPGRFLISMRELDSVGVLDFDTGRIVWAMKGLWHRQHEARMLDSGHVLLFDNKDEPNRSKVLEVDPASDQIVWSYGTEPDQHIFSATCGQATRLPNGNTQINEARAGRIIEVTHDGDIVWEYINPNSTQSSKDIIAAFMDFQRLPSSFVPGWLEPPSRTQRVAKAEIPADSPAGVVTPLAPAR